MQNVAKKIAKLFFYLQKYTVFWAKKCQPSIDFTASKKKLKICDKTC